MRPLPLQRSVERIPGGMMIVPVAVTAICVPIVTAWWYRRVSRRAVPAAPVPRVEASTGAR